MSSGAESTTGIAGSSPQRKSRAGKLLQSGIIFSAISFLTGLGNLAFQIVLGHNLHSPGQFSKANGVINAIIPLLGLVPSVAVMAVTHYIAHFNAIGDATRLQELLAGCRKFLFRLTVFGSILAIVAVKPLSSFFNLTSTTMLLLTIIYTLISLWTSLATALCQGLAWFNRLALIAFVAMLLRLVFGYVATLKWPYPEMSVLASVFSFLAYLILFHWKKDLSPPKQPVTSTKLWNHEFILYLVVTGAFIVGNYCFSLSDLLVMQKYFSDTASGDAYTAAERLAVSLPITVTPLLTVLFTNRSVEHSASALREQFKLLGVFAAGLIFGAVCLYFLRHFCLHLLGKDVPGAADMIQHLAVSMIFVGLLQAVGTWALASRWSKISLLFGALGLSYTAIIFTVGKTPDTLLHIMPLVTGSAFVILLLVWVVAMRRHKPVA